MKKAWSDLKSFITVITMLLFAYCIVRQVPIDETLKTTLATVVGFFLGSKINSKEDEWTMEDEVMQPVDEIKEENYTEEV